MGFDEAGSGGRMRVTGQHRTPNRKEDPVPTDHDLDRFVRAQEGRLPMVLAELSAGKKRTHWMWFVFPQIQGLGRSGTAQRFAIQGVDEAKAFLAHDVLGPRLRDCTRAVMHQPNRAAEKIFGFPDWLKFRSCMTLFSQVDGPESLFHKALNTFFGGVPDEKTLDRL